MKKNSLIIISFISLLLIFFFYVIVKNDDIFLFTLGLSLFMILVSLFSHIDVLKVMKKYSNREYYYTRDKIFKICLLIIVGIGLILVLVTVLLSLLLENIMHIDNMLLVMTIMCINVIAIPLLRLLKNFLVIHNFKTLSKYIIHIYIVMIDVYVLLVSYISFVKLKLPSYISITGLFMAPLTILCLLFIVVMILWYMKNKGFKKKYIIKREEVKIDIKKDIKKIFNDNIRYSMIMIVTNFIPYISIILFYVCLVNHFGYPYDDTVRVINITYLYGYVVIYFLVSCFWVLVRNKLNYIKKEIINKNYDVVSLHFASYFNNLLKILLPIVITLSVISGSIWMLLYGDYNGTTILMLLFIMSLFLIIYLLLIQVIASFNNKKMLGLVIGILLLVKIVFTIPMIGSFYRMGYELIYGNIVASMMAYLCASIVSIILINNKCHVNFSKCFDKTLTIIYENILLSLILVLLQLVISTYVNNRLQALGVILVYMIIAVVFYLGKNCLNRYLKK